MTRPVFPAVCFLMLLGVPVQAQLITALVNSASYATGVSPGTLATIFGSDLTTGTAGTTVYVNEISAPLLYVSAGQINIQIPYEVALGSAEVVVSQYGVATNTFNFEVLEAAPGIFADANQNSISQNADGSLNTQSNPAAPGSTVVYMVGIGPLNNSVATGQVAPDAPLSIATEAVSATVGGQEAAVSFLGLTPGFIGLAQANIVVPNLSNGDYPMTIYVGQNESNSPYLAVAADGVTDPAKVPRKAK